MSDSLKDFLYEIGFVTDPSGAAKVDALAKQTEAKLTATAQAGAAKRVEVEAAAGAKVASNLSKWLAARAEAEAKAAEERRELTQKVLLEMLGLEADAAGKITARHKAEAGKATEFEKDRAKKSREIRTAQFKEVETGLLRFASFSQALATGLSGALSAAPFGAFLTGVERTASGLSRLAVQSQRVGASVAGIERFKFALRQQGVDEGEATGALEGFSKTVQSNPQGYRQVLERMGVRTKDKNGKDLNNDELLEGFGSHLAGLPLNLARIQAGQLGVSGDNAINALRNPAETHKGLNAYDDKLKAFNFDPNKAAEDARKVDQAYGNLEADLRIIHTKLDAEFFVPMMNGFDALAKKIEQNPQAIENYGRALEAFAALAAARILPTIANLLVKFTGLQAILGGGLGAALGIALNPVVVAGASAESTPTAPVTTDPAERARKLANNTLPAGEMTAAEREAFSKAHGGGLWDWVKQKIGLGGGSGAEDGRVKDAIIQTAEGVKKLADKADEASVGGGGGGGVTGAIGRTLRSAGAAAGGGFSAGGASRPAKGALAANQKEAYAAALAEGLSPTAARALIANMSGEGLAVPHDRHWDGTHYAQGIVQWDPTRTAAIAAKFGKQPMNMSVAEQTKAAIWEMKNKYPTTWHALQGNNGPAMIDALVDDYERPGNRGRAKAQRYGYYRGFNPTVYVNGTPSSASGDHVEREADGTLKLPFRTLGRYIKTTRPMFARGELGHATNQHPGEVAKVEVVKSNLDPAHQKLADAMHSAATKPLPNLSKMHEMIAKHAAAGTLHSILNPSAHHLGVSAALSASINASRNHHHFERHGDTFHVHGADAKSGLDSAHKLSARRDAQDRIRYMQGSQQ
ncbi:MAG: phage tail tip lysozyme [Janthinobacterium lividum]